MNVPKIYSATIPSLPESNASILVPRHGTFWRKLLAFIGPGFMVAVGYMDPGNWATDLAGGAKFGYALLSVILVSNIFAMLLQHLSLRLGIAAELDLAQACRAYFSRPVNFALWLLAEVAIAACDLAEVIGSAIALKLLFGIPIMAGVVITSLDVLIILLLQQRGFRVIESIVGGLVFLIFGCFVYELFVAQPDIAGVAKGLIPTTEIFNNKQMMYIAIGILGATVMPHNLYLHSSIVQTRAYDRDTRGKKEAIMFATIDSTGSLFLAFFINAAILITAAAAFHHTGYQDVADINDAHKLLDPVLGTQYAAIVFAIALLAAGQNSTLTGTLAGQIVMEGFLNLRLKPWIRRLVTRLIAIVPALIVTYYYGERGTGELLVLSQVILSLQLSFAVFPLVWFVGNRDMMGDNIAPTWLKTLCWGVAIIIAALNVWLLYMTFTA